MAIPNPRRVSPRARTRIAVKVVDGVRKPVQAASQMLPREFELAAKRAEETLERHIKEAYRTGGARWRPLVDGGVAQLKETGALESAVENLRVRVRALGPRQRKSITVAIDANWPRNPRGRQYIWYHEFGTSIMARREFIHTGVRNAGPEVASHFSFPLSAINVVLTRPEELGLTPDVYDSRNKWLGILRPMALATVLVPPVAPFSQGLLLWGVSSDLKSLLEGALFSAAAIRNMVSAWALGMVGVTPRVQRRRARRTLWSGV
jgi:hypothetical protein